MASRQVGINEVETALKAWNVNLPTGSIVGPQRAFTLQATGQLMSAAAYRSLIVAWRNGSPVRLEELGQGDRQRGGRQDRLLVRQRQRYTARHRAGHPAAARHQYHGCDQRHQAAAAAVPGRVAAVGPHEHSLRPVRHHPGVLPRRAVHHGAHARPGRDGDLPVPAQRLRHHHPEPGAAVLGRRHLRRDVPAELQPGQPVDDGADPVASGSWWTTPS